jgi:hypothetical protein
MGTPVVSPAVSPPPGMVPTSQVASPAPAQTNPKLEKGSKAIITIVGLLKGISQDFAATSPIVRNMQDECRQLQLEMMKNSEPGEAAAPPMNG